MVSELFHIYDTNMDFAVTNAEFQAMNAMLAAELGLDPDATEDLDSEFFTRLSGGDGSLSRQELFDLLDDLLDLTDRETAYLNYDALCNAVDEDGDGFVTQEEIEHFKHMAEELIYSFDLDYDYDYALTADEVDLVLSVFERLDTDHDGVVTDSEVYHLVDEAYHLLDVLDTNFDDRVDTMDVFDAVGGLSDFAAMIDIDGNEELKKAELYAGVVASDEETLRASWANGEPIQVNWDDHDMA